MAAPRTPHVPQQALSPDDVEHDVARTADLVLKLASLAERYEAGSASADRIAAMKEVVMRGRRQLVALSGVDVAGLEPATSRV